MRRLRECSRRSKNHISSSRLPWRRPRGVNSTRLGLQSFAQTLRNRSRNAFGLTSSIRSRISFFAVSWSICSLSAGTLHLMDEGEYFRMFANLAGHSRVSLAGVLDYARERRPGRAAPHPTYQSGICEKLRFSQFRQSPMIARQCFVNEWVRAKASEIGCRNPVMLVKAISPDDRKQLSKDVAYTPGMGGKHHATPGRQVLEYG